ncbi:MAG: hypothetical protein HYU39_01040 [Thaumarchaeota archaeon]|nr:hypothetical protein [Nitrososphaerota archaeon]
MTLTIDSEEITEYVSAILDGIFGAMTEGYGKGFFLASSIKIQLGIQNVGERDGTLKLMVAGVGGKRSKQENARIEFEVFNPLAKELKEKFEAALKQTLGSSASTRPTKT